MVEPRPGSVWIENTSSKCDHGGLGWEFGKCVWCPTQDKRGAINKYKIICDVKAGDLVINCYDGKLRGTSKAMSDCFTTMERPPKAGEWSYATSYFRFDLEDFHEFETHKPVKELIDRFKNEISQEIETRRPKYYLFSWWPRSEWYPEGRVVVSQGRFLARATPALCMLIDSTVGLDKELFGPYMAG